jgi:uncharacterized protein (TIGR02145 family)
MFKNISSKSFGLMLGAFLSILLLSVAVFAWTGPTQAPPAGNISYPVTATNKTQLMGGSFSVSGVFQTDTNTHLAITNGSVGIGTDSPGGLLGIKDANTYIDVDASNNLTFTDAETGTKTLAQLAGTDFICGSVLSYEGQNYSTVKIGDQCWMAENLNYDNGCSSNSWTNSAPYDACGYNTTATGEEYGLLYQWDVANEVCPEGWHLPTDEEWKILEGQLGMSASEVDLSGVYRYSGNVGAKLKGGDGGSEEWNTICANSGTWYNGMNQSHLCYQSGFEALPGIYIGATGASLSVGPGTNFWSSTSDGTSAWRRLLGHVSSGVLRNTGSKAYGFSVRCLRDL